MSPSTANRNLWTMNPSRMTYRDHGKPPSSIFPYAYVISDMLRPYNPSICLSYRNSPITQLWNVLLRSRVKLLHLSVMFGSYRWLLVLLPVCRAFEPAEGSYLVRMLRSRDPSHHDRDAECDSTPRLLVDFIVPRVLAPAFGPRTWS